MQTKIIADTDISSFYVKINSLMDVRKLAVQSRGLSYYYLENRNGASFGYLKINVTTQVFNVNWLFLREANLSPAEYAVYNGLAKRILRFFKQEAQRLGCSTFAICNTHNYKLIVLAKENLGQNIMYRVTPERSEPALYDFANAPWFERGRWLHVGIRDTEPQALVYRYNDVRRSFIPYNAESRKIKVFFAEDKSYKLVFQVKKNKTLIPSLQIERIDFSNIDVDILIPLPKNRTEL